MSVSHFTALTAILDKKAVIYIPHNTTNIPTANITQQSTIFVRVTLSVIIIATMLPIGMLMSRMPARYVILPAPKPFTLFTRA